MKVAQSTPDLLVLSDLGAPIRAVGGVALVLGAAFVAAGLRAAGTAVTSTVIGSVVAITGVLMVVLPGRVTAAFDRVGRTLVITQRGMRGRTQDEVDLSKIAGVEAAESQALARPGQAPRGGGMYRVEILLRDGARLPLTSYYSNSPTHATAAAAARAFLGLAPPPPAPSVPPTLPPRPMPRPRPAVPLAFMSLISAVFVGVGGWLFASEGTRLANARPVPAVVLASDVRTVRSSGRNSSVTLKPVVLYRYSVNDRDYTADRVTPLNESRSGQWAYKLVARYPVGATVTAWYDPAHPERAFLLHEWSLLPLFFVVFPLVLVGLGAFMLIRARRASAAQPVAERTGS